MTLDCPEITKRGVAATAVENGNIMVCGGIVFTNDKEGTVWVKVSKKCLSQSFRWARTIKETFNIMMATIDNMQISTYILDKFCKGERMAKLIGLSRTNETTEFNGNIYNKYMVI